jgi:hypothetical protein
MIDGNTIVDVSITEDRHTTSQVPLSAMQLLPFVVNQENTSLK